MTDVAAIILAWLLTYAAHSTLLLGTVAVATAAAVKREGWRETLWKAALVGGFVTATVQSALDLHPLSRRWDIAGPAATHASAASSAPTHAAAPARSVSLPSSPAGGSERVAEGGGVGAPTKRPLAPATQLKVVAQRAWPSLVIGAWGVVAVLLLAVLLRRQGKLRRLLSNRRAVRDAALLRTLTELRRIAGVWRPVRLTVSSRCTTPLALGVAEICVPKQLLTDLTPEEQRSALAHELAHLARHDPLWQLGAGLIAAIFFFQPLNYLARRRLREAAEHLADDWAVGHTGSPLGLARCLSVVATWIAPRYEPVPHGTMAMAEGGSPLLKRVERIMADGVDRTVPRLGFRSAATSGLLLVATGAAPLISAGPRRDVMSWPPFSAIEAERPAHQGRVIIRHPVPGQPFARRWEWATMEAHRTGQSDYWIAYGFRSLVPGGGTYVTDSEGSWTADLRWAPLGQSLYGGAWQPVHVPAVQDVLVLFKVRPVPGRDVALGRVMVRTPEIGVDLGGLPLYWIDTAQDEESLALLERMLERTTEPTLRSTLLELIAVHRESDRVVPILSRVLQSDEAPRIRAAAAEGLGWHSSPETVALLRHTALRDAAREVQVEAAEALGQSRAREAVAALAGIIRSDAPLEVRHQAVEALGAFPRPEALELLADVALGPYVRVLQQEATETIGDIDMDDAVSLLERIARAHSDPVVRDEAIESLGDQSSPAAIDVLKRLLEGGTVSEVRKEVLEGLADTQDAEALQTLLQVAMHDPDPEVQQEAVEELAKFSSEDVAPVLRRLVWEHGNLSVRRQAAETLGDLPETVALPLLDGIVDQHPDGSVVQEAVEAIGGFPREMSVPRLVRILRGSQRLEARREALEQLREHEGWREAAPEPDTRSSH